MIYNTLQSGDFQCRSLQIPDPQFKSGWRLQRNPYPATISENRYFQKLPFSIDEGLMKFGIQDLMKFLFHYLHIKKYK